MVPRCAQSNVARTGARRACGTRTCGPHAYKALNTSLSGYRLYVVRTPGHPREEPSRRSQQGCSPSYEHHSHPFQALEEPNAFGRLPCAGSHRTTYFRSGRRPRTVALAAVCGYVAGMSACLEPLQEYRRSLRALWAIVLALLIAWTGAGLSFHGPRGARQTQVPTADLSGGSHQKAVRLSHAVLLHKSQQPLAPGAYPPGGSPFALTARSDGNSSSYLCDWRPPAADQDSPSFIRLRTRHPRDPPTETAVTRPLTA